MTWLAPGGGVDQNVFLTLQGLADGFEMHIAVGNEVYHNPFLTLENIRFIQCPDLIRPISLVADFKAIVFFYRLIKKENYDIVHTHETKASLITRIAAYLAGCEHIIYGLHGVTFNDPLSRSKRIFYIILEKLTVWMADYVVSVSQGAISEYHKAGIAVNKPYEIIYSGIDVESFARNKFSDGERLQKRLELGVAPHEILFINIGRFSWAKGQRFTIEAFSRLASKYSNIKLLLVGEGECKAECVEMARQLAISDRIIFYGFSQEVAKLAWLADIFVITSLREGLPRVVVEASLCMLPTVGFEVEGIREIIEDRHNGYIVPQNDIDGLVQRMEELLLSAELRKDFARRSHQEAKDKWDHRLMVDKLRKLYLALLGDK